MIYFHVIYDLYAFYDFKLNLDSGLYYMIGKVSAVLFILVSGISCLLSKSSVKRGFTLLLCAVLITVVTYFFIPDAVIVFGILHFFGISMIISKPFKKLNSIPLLILGTAIILLSIYFIDDIKPASNAFFPLGIINSKFASADYYPLLPWFGVFLYGIALGKIFYPKKKSIFKIKFKNTPINFLGKHTLLIYMIHQPIIAAILYVINYFFKITVAK
jgi:uncharacterized membrane protein